MTNAETLPKASSQNGMNNRPRIELAYDLKLLLVVLKYADRLKVLPSIVMELEPWKHSAFARYFEWNILHRRNHLEDNCYL